MSERAEAVTAPWPMAALRGVMTWLPKRNLETNPLAVPFIVPALLLLCSTFIYPLYTVLSQSLHGQDGQITLDG